MVHWVTSAHLSLILLDAWPGLDFGTVFDGEDHVLGGVGGHLPNEPGSVDLLVAGLLEPWNGAAAVGLNFVDHLLDKLGGANLLDLTSLD